MHGRATTRPFADLWSPVERSRRRCVSTSAGTRASLPVRGNAASQFGHVCGECIRSLNESNLLGLFVLDDALRDSQAPPTRRFISPCLSSRTARRCDRDTPASTLVFPATPLPELNQQEVVPRSPDTAPGSWCNLVNHPMHVTLLSRKRGRRSRLDRRRRHRLKAKAGILNTRSIASLHTTEWQGAGRKALVIELGAQGLRMNPDGGEGMLTRTRLCMARHARVFASHCLRGLAAQSPVLQGSRQAARRKLPKLSSFCASDEASYISGTRLTPDGGFTLTI